MKIEKIFNKKKGITEYQARFQLGNKEFRPRAATRKTLLETIDELRARQHRTKFELPVEKPSVTLQQLIDAHLPRIDKPHQRNIFDRVSKLLLSLLPKDIKITELKKAHFQKYIDLRLSQTGVQTKQPILGETVDKELYSISSALRAAPLYFTELEDYRKPELPKAARGKKRRRNRIVNKDSELAILLAELRQPRTGKQTFFHETQRRRLADDLEFRAETGLRRIESARLKFEQFRADEQALRDVVRWKTGTITKFFPITRRAAEIIEHRRKVQNDAEWIFSDDGEANESDYRALKALCGKLGIPYGRYTANGFVPHDLRRSFATDLIENADVETVRELLGHSNIGQTGQYLKTNEKRLSAAIAKKDKTEAISEIVRLYKDVKRGKIRLKKFVEKVKNLGEF